MDEKTSIRVAKIASKGLKDPSRLTHDEIKIICASALTQAKDQIEDKSQESELRFD